MKLRRTISEVEVGSKTVHLHAQLFDILLLIIGYREFKNLNCAQPSTYASCVMFLYGLSMFRGSSAQLAPLSTVQSGVSRMIPNRRAPSRRQMDSLTFPIQQFKYARESITSCETRMSKPVSNLFHSNQIINYLAVRRERRSPERVADHRLSYSKDYQGRMFRCLQVGSFDFILEP